MVRHRTTPHSRTVPSHDPEASVAPSGAKATLNTRVSVSMKRNSTYLPQDIEEILHYEHPSEMVSQQLELLSHKL